MKSIARKENLNLCDALQLFQRESKLQQIELTFQQLEGGLECITNRRKEYKKKRQKLYFKTNYHCDV